MNSSPLLFPAKLVDAVPAKWQVGPRHHTGIRSSVDLRSGCQEEEKPIGLVLLGFLLPCATKSETSCVSLHALPL